MAERGFSLFFCSNTVCLFLFSLSFLLLCELWRLDVSRTVHTLLELVLSSRFLVLFTVRQLELIKKTARRFYNFETNSLLQHLQDAAVEAEVTASCRVTDTQ